MATRRDFLAGSLAMGTLGSVSLPAEARANTATRPLDALITLSRGTDGTPHIDLLRAIGRDGSVLGDANGPTALPISDSEAVVIADAFATRDHSPFHQAGVHVGGKKYFFIRDDDDGDVMLARRDGEGLCFQAFGDQILIVHSPLGATQGMANAALLKFMQRHSASV